MSHSKAPCHQELSQPQRLEVPFAANDVRLGPRGWGIAALLIAATLMLVPRLWQAIEPLEIGSDHRVPYRLGNDYWNYERTCREVAAGKGTLLIGDSVLWGHYVDCAGTLSHFLNEQAGDDLCDNLGIDGIHPVALVGLIEHYGSAIRNKRVILNCNPLWISSPRHDLSGNRETQFNHPALVPQFRPWISCYKASISARLGTVASRRLRFLGWANHLRIAYFAGDNLASWTIDHPSQNPFDEITLRLPSPDEPPSPRPDARPWSEKGIRRITPKWVDLEDSLQWKFFRRTVQLLKRRGNQVFVLIGPLNEHMLTESGLAEYQVRKRQIAAWHAAQAVPHFAPPALPSNAYADFSHPTATGYAQLAEQLLYLETFRSFLEHK